MTKKANAARQLNDSALVACTWAVKYHALCIEGRSEGAQASMNELIRIMGAEHAARLAEFCATLRDAAPTEGPMTDDRNALAARILQAGKSIPPICNCGQGWRNPECPAHPSKAELQSGRWVACADKLPEEHGEYLAASRPRPRGWVTVYAPAGWICPIDFPVTHWMPLPEPAPQAKRP